MILDDADKIKFLKWLEQQIANCEGIATQMEKLGSPVMEELAKREKQKAMAFTVVAHELTSYEKF